MSQNLIMDFLHQNQNEWYTSKQIAENLKANHASIIHNLEKLRKEQGWYIQSEIIWEKKCNKYFYKYNKRIIQI